MNNLKSIGGKAKITLLLVIFLMLAVARPLLSSISTSVNAQNVQGAIFTTDSACSGTNVNIYANKEEVYLDGGPAHPNAAGLPDGSYYARVTDPDGTVLGTSIGSSNQQPVVVVDGKFTQCYQLWAILIKASNGIQGYDTTTNPGGEYKVWISFDPNFANDSTKTDNFKVIPETPTPTNTPSPIPTEPTAIPTPSDTPITTPTNSPTPTNTPILTPTNTPTPTTVPCNDINLCSLIRSPGFWTNWRNHFTEAQVAALIGGTQDYSSLTVAQAEAILNNTSDQYHRHLLTAELNVSWHPELGNGIYTVGSLAGMTVNQILHLAYTTDPSVASQDLINAINYLGGDGENAQDCLVVPPCVTPTVTPTNTPTPTATPTNTPAPTATNTPGPTNTPVPGPTDTPGPGPTNTPGPGPTATPGPGGTVQGTTTNPPGTTTNPSVLGIATTAPKIGGVGEVLGATTKKKNPVIAGIKKTNDPKGQVLGATTKKLPKTGVSDFTSQDELPTGNEEVVGKTVTVMKLGINGAQVYKGSTLGSDLTVGDNTELLNYNNVYYAHYNAFDKAFGKLGTLSTGDSILVNENGKTQVYLVSSVVEVSDTNTAVLNDNTPDNLVLMTCDRANPALRIVVTAKALVN